ASGPTVTAEAQAAVRAHQPPGVRRHDDRRPALGTHGRAGIDYAVRSSPPVPAHALCHRPILPGVSYLSLRFPRGPGSLPWIINYMVTISFPFCTSRGPDGGRRVPAAG